MGLCLTLRKDNTIILDTPAGPVRIELRKIKGFTATVDFDAPRSIQIWREDRCDQPPRSDRLPIDELLNPETPTSPTGSC